MLLSYYKTIVSPDTMILNNVTFYTFAFVCLYNYEFGLSLCKIVRSSVILLLPLFKIIVSGLTMVL